MIEGLAFWTYGSPFVVKNKKGKPPWKELPLFIGIAVMDFQWLGKTDYWAISCSISREA